MQNLTAAKDWLGRRAENVVALLLGTMFAAFIIQIVFRYVLNLPLGWTIEYVSIVWLWGILFGYAFVVKDPDIIRLDVVYSAVSTPVQRMMDVFTGLTTAGIFLWSLPQVYDYVTFMGIERTAFMRIRFDLVFSIYLPFAVSVSIRALINVYWALNGNHERYSKTPNPESHDYD